jgi:hypothetical protein
LGHIRFLSLTLCHLPGVCLLTLYPLQDYITANPLCIINISLRLVWHLGASYIKSATHFVALPRCHRYHCRLFYNRIRRRCNCQLKASAKSRLMREWRWVCGFAHPTGIIVLQGRAQAKRLETARRTTTTLIYSMCDSGIQSVLENHLFDSRRLHFNTCDRHRTSCNPLPTPRSTLPPLRFPTEMFVAIFNLTSVMPMMTASVV